MIKSPPVNGNLYYCIYQESIQSRPHLTQDTNGKVTNTHLDTINESQEVSPFPAADHKAHINRRAQKHSKHKTEKNKKDPQNSQVHNFQKLKNISLRAVNFFSNKNKSNLFE